jgi:hypothetical protein
MGIGGVFVAGMARSHTILPLRERATLATAAFTLWERAIPATAAAGRD